MAQLEGGWWPSAGRRFGSVLVVWLALLVTAAPGRVAATADAETPPQPAEAEEEPAAVEEGGDEPTADPCAPVVPVGDDWIDALNLKLYTTVCGSARWVDSFFGNDIAFDEADRTYGWTSLNLWWSEVDELETRFRFKARYALPNLDHRLSLVTGRVGDDELLQPNFDSTDSLPAAFREDVGESWLLGLGYTPVSSVRSHFNIGVGVRLDWPPDPYVRARYRYLFLLGERSLIRLRPTAYWYSVDGFGFNTTVDVDWRLRRSTMLRWSGSGTVSELAEEVEYWSSLNLYQKLSPTNGLTLQMWVQGDTGLEETVEEYGVRLTFRRRFLRDWLFLDLGTGVTWPKVEEVRESSWGAGVGVELQFGMPAGWGTWGRR